jgi:prepilin-type N-terminal cleavage/methylation domain-containing protein
MEKLMRQRRGFTIIEVVIAMVVLAIGIMVIISSFSMNLRQSSQTREELMANLIMESLIEEVLDHTYGDAPPSTWKGGQVSFPGVVDGRTVQSVFTQKVDISKKTGSGSFFGQGDKGTNTDVVTMTVTWTQASAEGSAGQDKILTADLTVTRKP